jgi:hypothetical protein
VNNLAIYLISVVVLGLGAPFTFDVWGQLVKLAFKFAPSNICLVGRWILYMPHGTFKHAGIASSPPKRTECTVGWLAHYLIGISFASVFVALTGLGWLQHPTPAPAVAFGIVSSAAPFFIMQPLFGLGLASAKASNPTLARLRTLMNHAAFGAGLYLFALFLEVACQ